MDGNLTGNIREFLPIVGERVPFFAPSLSAMLLLLSSHSSNPLHLSLRPSQEPGPHICPYLSPGHVQVAQVPGRGDPGSPGELNFPYLFQLLEDEGYKGFVGCEYQPQGEGWALGEGSIGGAGIGQGLFASSWVEMPLPPSPLRRHSGELELATLLLG